MTRPPSIVWFERLYLGSLLLSLLTTVLFWSRNREVALASAQSAQGMAGLIGPIMIATMVVTVAVSLLFWWLVARQRSEAGKWLVAVTEAIGAVFGLFALIQLGRGTAVNPTGAALNLVATALAVVAAALLFRADARGWFRDGTGVLDDSRP